MIRRAKIEDIKEICDIENFYPKYQKWKEEGFKKEFDKNFSIILVYEKNNKILGFLNFWILSTEIEINTLVVHPLNLRKNIASSLLKKVFEYAKKNKVSKILLEVEENNIPALKLYEKFNFKEFMRRGKYYNNTNDAIVMEKYI